MNAFDAALRVLFSDPNLSVAADYTPAQQLPVPLRVVFNQPEAVAKGGFSSSPTITRQDRADLLVADVPVKPGRGCTLQVGDQLYSFADVTVERGGRIWRAALAHV